MLMMGVRIWVRAFGVFWAWKELDIYNADFVPLPSIIFHLDCTVIGDGGAFIYVNGFKICTKFVVV